MFVFWIYIGNTLILSRTLRQLTTNLEYCCQLPCRLIGGPTTLSTSHRWPQVSGDGARSDIQGGPTYVTRTDLDSLGKPYWPSVLRFSWLKNKSVRPQLTSSPVRKRFQGAVTETQRVLLSGCRSAVVVVVLRMYIRASGPNRRRWWSTCMPQVHHQFIWSLLVIC